MNVNNSESEWSQLRYGWRTVCFLLVIWQFTMCPIDCLPGVVESAGTIVFDGSAEPVSQGWEQELCENEVLDLHRRRTLISKATRSISWVGESTTPAKYARVELPLSFVVTNGYRLCRLN